MGKTCKTGVTTQESLKLALDEAAEGQKTMFYSGLKADGMLPPPCRGMGDWGAGAGGRGWAPRALGMCLMDNSA